jgi:predicted dithiol-disulfide oxidoreductase (DUF899 family)
MSPAETATVKHRVVARDEWIRKRVELLAEEKEFTRQRDALSAKRRELPWVKVDKEYVFDGPRGKVALADLFEGRSQLLLYHFMFDPEWSQGCRSCSFLSDHYNPAVIHLHHRDTSMATVSRAPIEKIEAFRERMGWSFPWVSSFRNDFNRDFNVTFTKEEMETGRVQYNYRTGRFPVTEAPGLSVFIRDRGTIYHTYSTYARGLDMFLTTYHLLDTTPKGRNEEAGMSWVRHHDRYDDEHFVDPWKE